ncbi:MAG: hypothetical protein AAF698_02105, partial [Pseudomonadota bacterium]
AAVTPRVEPTTRTVPVLVDLRAEDGFAMGEVVRLILARRVEARGAWVPLTALKEAERGLWSIQTITGPADDQRVAREAVEILHVADGRAFVRGSVADGALVVPVGVHRLGQGQRVSAIREN